MTTHPILAGNVAAIKQAVMHYDATVTTHDFEKPWTLAAVECATEAQTRPLSTAELTVLLQVLVNAVAVTEYLIDDFHDMRSCLYRTEQAATAALTTLADERTLYVMAVAALGFKPQVAIQQTRSVPSK